MEIIEELNEADYQGEVKLNKPMRGGRNIMFMLKSKNGKVKKISFGDVHGGLTAK
jgi:hypothetical protein